MKSVLRYTAAGVALATFGFASAASAATTDSADVQAEILTALSVTVDPADDTLDFGTIADGGITANANLTVTAATGNLVACPANLICGGTTDAPTFNIEGLATLLVDVSFTNATETLSHPAPALFPTMVTTLTAGTFTTDLVGNQATLDAAGDAAFHVGGTLTVAPNQAPGVYTGSVTVEVEYN
jgi:hypothetical protein